MTINKIVKHYPLSSPQRDIWFEQRPYPDVPLCNIGGYLRIDGPLELTTFKQALNQVVQDHETLRINLHQEEALPVQLVMENISVPVAYHDFSEQDHAHTVAQAWMAQEFVKPFPLDDGPLCQFALSKISAQCYYWFCKYHHLIVDKSAVSLIVQRVAEVYNAFLTEKPSAKPNSHSYLVFVEHDQAYLNSATFIQHEQYWLEKYQSQPEPLIVPRSAVQAKPQSITRQRATLCLKPDFYSQLTEFAHQNNTSLFQIILGALYCYFVRTGLREDLVIGLEVPNRNTVAFEQTIGCFATVSPAWLRFGTELNGLELLKAIELELQHNNDNQAFPLSELNQRLGLPQENRQQLFDITLSYIKSPDKVDFNGNSSHFVYLTHSFQAHALSVQIEELPESINLHFDYHLSAFSEEEMMLIKARIEFILDEIIHKPSRPIHALQIMPEAELQQILYEFNDTATDYPLDKCIHHLFEEQVEQTPNAIAVVFEEQSLTYASLNQKANQLAHHLQTLGVKPEVLVGICVKRSLEMVIGLLGILKAGGAYVPLDTNWPKGRIKYILASQNIQHLITQYTLLPTFQAVQWQLSELTNIICLDIQTPKPPPEALNPESTQMLWDRVAERATDEITAGGFISSYTGEAFTKAEVTEYKNFIMDLTQPYLAQNKRVLEIGCGAGLIMFAIAPQVGFYVGLDPSGVTQSRNQEYLVQQGYTNVKLVTAFAHDLNTIGTTSFDLIILASTVQFFPGYLYLQHIIEMALDHLVPGGTLLIADVMDPRQKETFRKSLEAFKRNQPLHKSSRTKTHLESEFYVDEDFFKTLPATLDSLAGVSVFKRQTGFSSELRYRYDVLLRKKSVAGEFINPPIANQKNLWTNWHLNQQTIENPVTTLTPDNLAYIIYTSGSTGVPKGVAVRHLPVINLIDWVNKTFHISSSDRILFVTSYCFDLSVYDIFGLLAAGGSIHIASESLLKNPEKLVYTLYHQSITFWDSAPAALQQLVTFFQPLHSLTPSLRLVFLSGDWIPVRLPEIVKEAFPGVQVIGLGGATEATVWSNYYPIEEVLPQWTSIPYGKPIQNAKYYILDGLLNPCPIGVPGGLYIGGECLASEYANDLEQTAQKFIPSPFDDKTGARLYHTGDLARYLPDGNIEFLGRIDNQVKLRGFRIELGEIETTLKQHPMVQEAVVMLNKSETTHQLIAYVVYPSTQTVPTQVPETEFSTESISQWEQVYDDAYTQSISIDDPTFNIAGWNDSYKTNQLIPAEDIREWVDLTVERILGYHPKRILEIGCGTGLLLFRLAPHCTWYGGTDISSEGLRYIKQQITKMADKVSWPPIPLYHQPAHDFTPFQSESVDTIIINSVVPHFPSIEYLVSVLEKAISQLSSGGVIFLGDLFSLSLRETLHASAQLYKAPPSLSKLNLYQRIQQQLAQEDKLLIDPRFFWALKQQLPKINHVSIHLKRGVRHNEMTRFRYDVVIHVGTKMPVIETVPELDWQKDKFNLALVEQILANKQPKTLVIKDIPNVRIRTEIKLLELLYQEKGPNTVAEIREFLSTLPQATDPDPEAFWRLGDNLPYDVYLTPSFSHKECYHAIFRRLEQLETGLRNQVPLVEKTGSLKHWSSYANNPQQWKLAKELVPQLRSFLKETLPDYMIPAAFVVLSHLPLTPNGKVDRRALSHMHFQRYLETTFVAPRTSTEEKLADIWASILGVEQVGIHDNFFELGGHSLQATQVISRIRDSFACELPLHDLFALPTIAQLGKYLETTRSDKQLPLITPVARNQPLPLSFAQQRMWFLAQLEGEYAIAYNESWALLLEGFLNQTVLERSLQEIVQRHEVLRTTFPIVDGEPVQQIHSFSKNGLNLAVIDLQNLPVQQQNGEEQRLFKVAAQYPFNLSQGPLFRTILISKALDEYVLLLNLHHIIFDGWSQSLFIEELSICYEAFSQHQQPSLPPLAIQYVDFASWQRQWLSGERLEKQLDYWKQQLAGIPSLLQLPTDFPRPPIQRFQGASCPIHISVELTEQLQALSNQMGATLFMTLLSGFAILLARYSGQNDIVIGSPIANRTHSQTESLIGFFVNTLVLRLDLSNNPSVETVLQQARRVALEAYNHQDIPFEQLVEELKPERNLSHSPLFQVILQLQDAPVSNWEFSGLTLTQLELESVNAKFDLSLILEKTAQGLEGKLEYNTELFKASTIKRFTEHFKKLLDGVVKTERKSIYELPLLTEAEQQQLIAWNDTATDYPANQTIVTLFEQQVEKTPDNIAVVFENQQLSYGQLNDRANQLAHYLLSLKRLYDTVLLGNNPLIAIAVERSLEMVIGLLGILKMGGAYVPIDPSYPAIRIRYMLSDSAAPLLLTQSHLKAQLSLDELEHDCVVVCLDEGDFANQPLGNPPVNRFATDLAYVIYTSGSTGMPKGVAIEHSSPVQLINWANKVFDSAQLAGVLASTSICFDLSIFELFVPLSQGGGVIVIEDVLQLQHQNEAPLPITLLNTVPSAATALLNTDAIPPSVQVINLAGEPLKKALVQRLYKATSVQYIYNLYGPSEDTTYSTFTLVAPNSATEPTIGIPITNTRIYILNAQHELQPAGIPGELCIAGTGLARGYLNRPELTAEKFIEVELFGKTERIYKTGDLARWLEDGNLEYLGRLDNQIKIRGFRIELGEIESVLATHPLVTESVVIVHETESGDKRLVAFVVPSQGQSIDNQALRTFLTERLPDYMIPSTFVAKTSLPLTPNGKIDRQALSQLSVSNYQSAEAALIGPRDILELQLTQIWETVLEVRPIGVRDNFFELGGHSLLAVRLMAQIEQQLNKPLPLATLFQGATIEQLATRLRQPMDTEVWSPLVPIQPKGDKPPLFGVHPGGGHVLCYFELAQHLGTEQPFYGLQAIGMEAGQQPKTTVEEMATGYLKALQTVQKQGPYQLVGWSFGGVVAFEMARQLQAQGQSVSFLALLDTVTPAWFTDNSPESETNEAQLLVDLFAETNLSLSVEHLQSLNPDEQLNYVMAQGQQANLFSPAVKPAKIKRLLDVYQANRQAFQRYQPQFYEGKLTVFPATERRDNLSLKSSLGWEKFTTEAVESYPVPGNHYNMVYSPHVQVLAEQLKQGFNSISE